MGVDHGLANKMLAPLAAKLVMVEGVVSGWEGVYLLVVKKIEVQKQSDQILVWNN